MQKTALFLLSIGLLFVVLSGLQFHSHPFQSWFALLFLASGGALFYLSNRQAAKKEEKNDY